tara:strand:- start:84050 stop:84223 length:174 start_codon:yes stop_codon:yes gene_type:complete
MSFSGGRFMSPFERWNLVPKDSTTELHGKMDLVFRVSPFLSWLIPLVGFVRLRHIHE